MDDKLVKGLNAQDNAAQELTDADLDKVSGGLDSAPPIPFKTENIQPLQMKNKKRGERNGR